MKRNPVFLVLGVTLVLAVMIPLLAQDSATTTAPIVKSSEAEVIISVRVKDFVPGKNYRLGLGAAGSAFPEGTYTLKKNDQPLSLAVADFTQKYTQDWWGVAQVAAKGFQLSASELPPAGTELLFSVAIPRDTASKFEKLFIFVSRDYGSGTWYLEDGSELDNSYW